MNSCRILYILVPLIAFARFSVHGLLIPDQSLDSTTEEEEDVKTSTVTETTEVQTEESIVENKDEAIVMAKGGGVVAGSVKDGDAIAVAISEDENGILSSAQLDGEGVLSAATGDGKAMSSDSNNLRSTMAESSNGTAVAVKGAGNAVVSGDASSGDKEEAKTLVKSDEGKASGSASGKGAASVSNVKGRKSSGSSSAATGISSAMGAIEDMTDGFGEALGTLTIKGSSGGGIASSGSATSGKAATSLSGSDYGGNDYNTGGDVIENSLNGNKAGALAISTNMK